MGPGQGVRNVMIKKWILQGGWDQGGTSNTAEGKGKNQSNWREKRRRGTGGDKKALKKDSKTLRWDLKDRYRLLVQGRIGAQRRGNGVRRITLKNSMGVGKSRPGGPQRINTSVRGAERSSSLD